MNSIKHLKRSVLFFLSLIMFISCSNEIYFNYSENSFDRLFVQEQIGIGQTNFFLWGNGGAGEISLPEDSNSIKITGTGYYINCLGFERNDANKYFNMEDVKYLSFKIRGNIPLQRILSYVTTSAGDAGKSKRLYDFAEIPDTYSEENFVSVFIDLTDVPQECLKTVIKPFVFFVDNQGASDGEDQYSAGQWVEIYGIDFLDENRNHVKIDYRAPESTGSLSDVINRLNLDGVDIQSWENTCSIEILKTGLRIHSLGSTWFGGAIATTSGTYADFSKVSSISFKIRGNMKPEEVAVGFSALGYNGTTVLSTLNPDASFDEENYASYSLEIPETLTQLKRLHVSQILCFNQGSSYSGAGKWIEIKDVSYLDENDNPVKINNSKLEEVSGSWDVLFADIDAEKTRIDLQVWTDWSGNADLTLTEEGLRVIPTGRWAGGGVVNYEANLGETYYKAFDFSNIIRMEYEIKGDIDPRYLRIYVMRNSYMGSDGNNVGEASTPSGTLYDIGVSEIKEDEWTTVSFDIPDEMSEVNDPFTFVTVNGDGDDTSGWAGRYFIIRNITYYDAEGNSVELKYVK